MTSQVKRCSKCGRNYVFQHNFCIAKKEIKLKLKMNEKLRIKKKELKTLLFWAHVGTLYSIGGSNSDIIPKLIVKWMNKLGLSPNAFCNFNQPEGNKIAMRVRNEWENSK